MELGTESNCVSLSHNNTTHSCDNGIANRPAHPNSDVGLPATQTSHDDVSVHQSPAVWDTGTDRRTSHTGAVDDQREGSHRAVRSLILIMALSLHHLFEGMSMGLHRSVAGVFTLLIALLCHETIISFSLGLQFVKCSYTPKQHYVTAFACSIVEPVGVAVGTYYTQPILA